MLHDLDTSSSRRTFLKLTAASATLAACSAEHGNRGKHVAVVSLRKVRRLELVSRSCSMEVLRR
ncbi:MAG: hypothetical protein AAFR21_12870, partial [Pseudomonadota bacterium]